MQNRQIDTISNRIKKDNKFKVFGSLVSREEACNIIISDLTSSIIGCQDDCQLYELLTGNWKSPMKWSNKDIQDALDDLLPENQWQG